MPADRLGRSETPVEAELNRRARGWQEAEAARARLEEALERIAAPKRPDGTYNLSREACEQIAREALHG